MNQYSVLMVDDEEEVIQVIMKKLDWESMGFRIAGYARNGVEALEMAEDLQPDVVMTDIKMPYMDGLTLCKKLKELYENVKIIIFSGFDEFEYAKEAIKIEVEEYILKPINANELREVFERIRNELDKELDEKRNIDKLRTYYLESLPVLQENFYTSLLEGRIPENQIEKFVKNYQIDLKGPYYVVTVLHISTSDTNAEAMQMNPFLLTVSVNKLMEEHLSEQWNCKTVTYLGDIILITQLQNMESIMYFTDTMNKMCKMAKRVCNAKVTAGIGHVCNAISQLQLSYQGAQNAVSYRVLYGNTRAINIAEIAPKENTDIPWEEAYIQKILKKIKMGESAALETAIDSFINYSLNYKYSYQAAINVETRHRFEGLSLSHFPQ
jgi:two-component system response regulator YesN